MYLRIDPKEVSPVMREIVRRAFPNYKGKKFTVSDEVPLRLNSYWDGGSRDFYVFVHLKSGKSKEVHSNHPFFEAGQPRDLPNGLPEDVILVKHSIFCGKDCGVTIYIGEHNKNHLLPESEKIDLEEDEMKVLCITYSYVSSARREYYVRHKIGGQRLQDILDKLMSLKLLRKNRSITPKGCNLVDRIRTEKGRFYV